MVNGLDCGLIRDDLDGDWTVSFVPESAFLVDCEVPAYDGTIVDVSNIATDYTGISVVASLSGAGFDVRESDANPPDELIASVEADSCLALVQTWENDDGGWVQCIGTLDRSAHAIPALCDSMDLDTDLNGSPDVACNLDRSLTVQVLTP